MKVVVVGAGVGGLAAAARLAAAGHTVTLLEAAPVVGGKLGRFEKDGFAFDTGPSLLTMPQVFRDLFAETGGWPGDLELERLDPIARYRFADGTAFDARDGEQALCAELDRALGPGSGDDWRGFLARAERVWDASSGPFLESPLDGPRTLARLAVQHPKDLAVIAPGRSLRGLGRRHLRDPRLRTFLDRYATYTGSDPRRLPAVLSVVPFVEQEFGAWHVRGGLRRLADALVGRLGALGVDVRTGAEVVAIETAAGRVRGVRLADGERLAAQVVVANADAAHVYGDLLGDARVRRPRRTQPSSAGFVLLLALRGRTRDRAHHRVLFPADYDAEFDALFGRIPRPVADPTVYVCAPDDPQLHPPGCESWFVLVNAPRHDPVSGVDWTAPGLAERYAGRVLDVLAARGLDVRDRLLWREIRTPADLERDTGAPGGAIYGSSSNGPRAALLRPANAGPVPGLYLAGGSVHPGGGLPLVAMSAEIVAGLVGPARRPRDGHREMSQPDE